MLVCTLTNLYDIFTMYSDVVNGYKREKKRLEYIPPLKELKSFCFDEKF